MKNRAPKYPGRVRLTPVAGQPNVYDMTRADEPTEEGTPINKSTLLTDQTADRYGLDEDGTPDDAFAFLGNYTEWRWNRRTVVFEEVVGANTSKSSSSSTVTARWSSAVRINQQDGRVTMVSPKTVSASNSNGSSNNVSEVFTPLKGNYLSFDSGATIYYAGSSYKVQVSISSGSSTGNATFSGLNQVSSEKQYGPWEEVRASTDDAYPNSGISGGYEYEAQGMPLEKAAALPLSALLSMLAEQEQLRADVDFLAVMGGVEL